MSSNPEHSPLEIELAKSFSSHGASVILHGRKEEQLKVLCEELNANKKIPSQQHHYVVEDLGNIQNHKDLEAKAKSLVEQVKRFTEAVHICVHSGGVIKATTSSFEEFPIAEFDRFLTLNLSFPFW